jgi:UDP-arabinose 4-epimerase
VSATLRILKPWQEEEILTVLVVGGAGYIGSHAARVLRRQGFEVLLYDNLSTGHAALAKGFELVVGDVAETGKLADAMKRSQAVMHFAAYAYVGESVQDPRKYFRNNVEGGLALLNTAVDVGLRNVIFSSTCAVYGVPASVPISEDQPRQPVNPYGISKLFFERALEAYDLAYGLRFASLRYFNAAGADEAGETGECHDPESHLIPLALSAATDQGPALQVFGTDYPTADGTCVRDYVHVTDLAEAHVKALEHLLGGGSSIALNLGTGRGHSVNEVMTAIEGVTGKAVRKQFGPRRPGDPPALVADPRRAEAVLGWKAKRSLTEIVSTAWQWMQRSPA